MSRFELCNEKLINFGSLLFVTGVDKVFKNVISSQSRSEEISRRRDFIFGNTKDILSIRATYSPEGKLDFLDPHIE